MVIELTIGHGFEHSAHAVFRPQQDLIGHRRQIVDVFLLQQGQQFGLSQLVGCKLRTDITKSLQRFS